MTPKNGETGISKEEYARVTRKHTVRPLSPKYRPGIPYPPNHETTGLNVTLSAPTLQRQKQGG